MVGAAEAEGVGVLAHRRDAKGNMFFQRDAEFHPASANTVNPASGLIKVNGSKTTPVLCTPTQMTPCFDRPAAGQFGNMQYNALSGPRFVNQDFSVIKRTNVRKISENFNFELRFEFFNAFNHPNFTGITSGLDDNTFGQLTSTVDTVRGGGVTSRIIQWAIRLNW